MRKYILFTLASVLLIGMIYIIGQWAIVGANAKPSDFAPFYYAGSVILDPTTPNDRIYNGSSELYKQYGITDPYMPYIYAPVAAYAFAPLTMLPYETAKLVWNLLSLALYMVAIAIIITQMKFAPALAVLFAAFALSWPPLWHNLRWAQTNTLLFLLVVLSVVAAEKKHSGISGLLLGVAALFKIFPIGIALVLGVKNWRIAITALTVFLVLSLQSTHWSDGIAMQPHHSYLYNALINTNLTLYIVFFVLVVAGTGMVALVGRNASYSLLACFGMTGVFLALPVVTLYHQVMLVLPLLFMLGRSTIHFTVMALISYILIAYHFPNNPMNTLGIFVLWFTLGYHLFKEGTRTEAKVY